MGQRHFADGTIRFLRWAALPLFAVAVFGVYRWAEHAALPLQNVQAANRPRVTITLENAPFTAYSDGRKTWSLWAGRIDLERQPASPLSHVDSATLTDIQRGTLYDVPDLSAPSAPARKAKTSTSPPPAATFHAQHGRYSQDAGEPLSPDLAPLFVPRWQFRLTGDVTFAARSGEKLHAPALTILEMTNRKTGRIERRIVCEEGATVEAHGVHLQSNSIRYNPADHSVECVSGARAVFSSGTIQSDRVYWLPDRQLLLCPDTSAGTIRGTPFQAVNLTVDVRKRMVHANHATLQIRMDSDTETLGP